MSRTRELALPRDLAAFLRQGRQLDYDPRGCSAGRVTLLPLDALRLHLFPMDCQSMPVADDDPNRRSLGCYLVPGVSLLATASGYEPDGLLLWLPLERRYGTWDSSHDGLSLYPRQLKWADYVADPKKHINACWHSWDGMMTCPRPWLKCRHHPDQLSGPIVIVPVDPVETFRVLDYKAVYDEQAGRVEGKVVGFDGVTATGPTTPTTTRRLRDALVAAIT